MDLSSARARIASLPASNAFISITSESGEGAVAAIKDVIRVRGTVTTGGRSFYRMSPIW